MFKYVSLGDSIAYGMSSDPEKSFSYLFSTFLKSQTIQEYAYFNMAVPGLTTMDLYDSINNTCGASEEILKSADIITISIGSNNLLGPIISVIPNVIKIRPNKLGIRKKLINLLLPSQLSRSMLNSMMSRGLIDFNRDWPLILSTIRAKAPKSVIYVLTLYNALKVDHPFFEFFNPYVVKVNQTIQSQAEQFQYDIVDVYTFFQNSQPPSIDFDFEQNALDPHPNNWGHQMIFDHLISKTNCYI